MQRIDLVCRGEERHRAKLLREHMGSLGVRVTIHAAPPSNPTPLVLFVLARGKAPDVGTTEPHQRVAIHFDSRAIEFDAAYHAPLQAWPARSADVEVKKLVYQLHRLERDRNAANQERREKPRTDPANKAAIGLVIVLVAAVVVLGQGDLGPATGREETLPEVSNYIESERVLDVSERDAPVSPSSRPDREIRASTTPRSYERSGFNETRPSKPESRVDAHVHDRSTIGHFCRAGSAEAKAAWYRLLDKSFADHPCVRAYERSRT